MVVNLYSLYYNMNHRLMDLKHIIQITVATVIELVSIRRALHKEEFYGSDYCW